MDERLKSWEGSAKSRLELIEMKENTVTREKASLEVERHKMVEDHKKNIE